MNNRDMLYEVATHITDPTTFFSFALCCKLTARICRFLTLTKQQQFLTEVVIDNKSKRYHVLPNGWRHGLYEMTWFVTGGLKKRVNYVYGDKEEVEEYWYMEGTRRAVYQYKNGKLNGWATKWGRNGETILWEYLYEDGVIVCDRPGGM